MRIWRDIILPQKICFCLLQKLINLDGDPQTVRLSSSRASLSFGIRGILLNLNDLTLQIFLLDRHRNDDRCRSILSDREVKVAAQIILFRTSWIGISFSVLFQIGWIFRVLIDWILGEINNWNGETLLPDKYFLRVADEDRSLGVCYKSLRWDWWQLELYLNPGMLPKRSIGKVKT